VGWGAELFGKTPTTKEPFAARARRMDRRVQGALISVPVNSRPLAAPGNRWRSPSGNASRSSIVDYATRCTSRQSPSVSVKRRDGPSPAPTSQPALLSAKPAGPGTRMHSTAVGGRTGLAMARERSTITVTLRTQSLLQSLDEGQPAPRPFIRKIRDHEIRRGAHRRQSELLRAGKRSPPHSSAPPKRSP